MADKCKTLRRALLFGAAAALLPTWLIAPGGSTRRQRAPFWGVNFAHRGLHSRSKAVPENSIEAFRLAARAGYGIELDVRLSRDGEVVVFHDDTLSRLCGIDRRVDELDYAALGKCKLCGQETTIPLFSEALQVIRGRGPLLVELKPSPRWRELCEKTYAMLEDYRGEVCIESFDPRIVAWFRFHARDLLRGQLAMPAARYVKEGESPLRGFVLSRCLLNCLARPQFIAYQIGRRPLAVRCAEMLGAMRVGWTSHEPRDTEGRDAVIFEFYKPQTRYK